MGPRGVGVAGLVVAIALYPSAARSAASQDWTPFVLVAGLLLIGLVADKDGLFAAAGHRLARTAPSGVFLFMGAVAMVGVVTAVLNLDTSVAFLTPVLVYTARSRGEGEAPLLYGCLLLSNAGSLFLPGSNLTNLIVVGHLHLNGGQFLAHTWAAALAAPGGDRSRGRWPSAERCGFGWRIQPRPTDRRWASDWWRYWRRPCSSWSCTTRRSPWPPSGRGRRRRIADRAENAKQVINVLGIPVLVGLFGVAVALGTLGRVWSGPATLCRISTSGVRQSSRRALGALNNLPAASLFAARVPTIPSRARRAQLGAEPVRDRLFGLVPLVAGGSIGRRPTLDRQGLPPRADRGAALDGCRPRGAGLDRSAMNQDTSNLRPRESAEAG